MRGVKHYMQRTALQGAPAVLSKIVGQWLPGADKPTGDVHPFRKRISELEIGYTLKTASRTVTLEDIEHFAHFTGDTFYAHMDDEAAKASPIFGGRVAHGYLILSFAAGLFVDPDPGPGARQYRPRDPALPDPALSGRFDAGGADRQVQVRPRRGKRRGALGGRRSSTRRTRSSRPTS